MSFGKQNTQTIVELALAKPDPVDQLINIVNYGDRFNLLQDPNVQAGNLDNKIHPIFHHSHFLGQTPHIKQALQLASLHLTTPSLLEFYLPLTFGVFHKERVGNKSRLYRTYTKSHTTTGDEELEIIKESMKCLSHSLKWEWKYFKGKLWGSTKHFKNVPTKHTPECPVYDDENEGTFFLPNTGTHISLEKAMLDFYLDERTGYVTRTLCDQFRHDFQLALVLVHELVHAYGAMSHGSLREPYLGRDHPDNEQGYAWENFMFGALIDPPTKSASGTYPHIYKPWINRDMTHKYRGREWTAMPVSWTAQWFRKETWEDVEVYGHCAVALPPRVLKIYYSLGLGRWVVYTDDEDARRDLEWGRESASLRCLFSDGGQDAAVCEAVSRAVWMPMSDLARMPLVPTPQRLFDEEIETQSEERSLYDAEEREYEVFTAIEAAKSKLTRPSMVSLATAIKTLGRNTRGLKQLRSSKPCSAAARSMTSNISEDSLGEDFPRGSLRKPVEHFLPHSSRNTKYRSEPYLRPPLPAANSTSTLGKRIKHLEQSDPSLPRRKI